MKEDKHYKRARRKVKDKKDFYKHLNSYITTNIIMLGMGLYLGFWRGWIPVIFFWGIGIFTHYVKTFGFPGFDNPDDENWEEKEIEKEMNRLKTLEELKERELPPLEKEEDAVNDTSLDIDEHLDLKEPEEIKRNYDESDLV